MAMHRFGSGGHHGMRLARILLLIAASLSVLAGVGGAQSLVGKQAPLFARRDLGGQTIDLHGLRGKVVLLNFWATWCAPCQTEMPVFDLWQREYGTQGLAVIGISMDDDRGAARRLVERMKIAYPVAMGDPRLGEQYGEILGLPVTFLIGRDGKVIAQFKGETDLKAMEARVKKALERP